MRRLRLSGWLLFLAIFFYLYFSRSTWITGGLRTAVLASSLLGYSLYLLLGCVRGFTFIPSTNLVLLAIPLFSPLPLFAATLVGILVSSASIYYFADSLQLPDYFQPKHEALVDRMKQVFQKNQVAIIVGWSFFPLVPTDLICYVCGILRVNFRKFIVGILVGEGAICGIYIFLGDHLLRFLRIRPW